MATGGPSSRLTSNHRTPIIDLTEEPPSQGHDTSSFATIHPPLPLASSTMAQALVDLTQDSNDPMPMPPDQPPSTRKRKRAQEEEEGGAVMAAGDKRRHAVASGDKGKARAVVMISQSDDDDEGATSHSPMFPRVHANGFHGKMRPATNCSICLDSLSHDEASKVPRACLPHVEDGGCVVISSPSGRGQKLNQVHDLWMLWNGGGDSCSRSSVS